MNNIVQSQVAKGSVLLLTPTFKESFTQHTKSSTRVIQTLDDTVAVATVRTSFHCHGHVRVAQGFAYVTRKRIFVVRKTPYGNLRCDQMSCDKVENLVIAI